MTFWNLLEYSFLLRPEVIKTICFGQIKTAKSGAKWAVLAILKMHQYKNPNIQSGTWLSKTYSVLSLTT